MSEDSKIPICDTCGEPSRIVKRVVIDRGYDRTAAKPLFNCPECYDKKNLERRVIEKPPEDSTE